MKNEVLVRAITEIDDELIVSAHRTQRSKKNPIMYIGTLAAACLLLICGVIFILHGDGEIESTPGIVLGEPTVSTQSISTLDLRNTTAQTVVTVTFDIDYDGDLTIAADDGTMTVFSNFSGTKEQIYVGQFCETNGSVTVEWTLSSPDSSQTYRIKVNNKETVALRYDQTTEQWTTAETEDKLP